MIWLCHSFVVPTSAAVLSISQLDGWQQCSHLHLIRIIFIVHRIVHVHIVSARTKKYGKQKQIIDEEKKIDTLRKHIKWFVWFVCCYKIKCANYIRMSFWYFSSSFFALTTSSFLAVEDLLPHIKSTSEKNNELMSESEQHLKYATGIRIYLYICWCWMNEQMTYI